MKSLRLPALALLLHLTAPCIAATPASGLDSASFDPAVRVQDDLFRSANGAWLKHTAIPANKSYVFGIEVNDITDARIRAIVDELAARPQKDGTLEQKVGAYYASYLDTAAIDKAGTAPLARLLAEVDAIGTPQELAAWQGRVQGTIETPVWLRVFPDLKDPTVNRVITWQGGLGLPDRDYYLKPEDARLAKALAAYSGYLTTLARLSGMPQPEAVAASVLALETKLAATHWKREDLTDFGKLYNPMSLQGLSAAAPGFNWAAFFDAATLASVETINVTQPSVASGTAALFTQLPLADWKLYFKLRLIDAYAPVLPLAFRETRFAFRGGALGGAQTQDPRWQQGIIALGGALGEGIGQLYVGHHFSPAHKARVQKIVEQVRAAYKESIEELTWMSPQTKVQALDKLAKMGSKIGYPDTWRDYTALQLRLGDALGNKTRAARFNWIAQAAKADRKVDRAGWQFNAHTVDAMYDVMLNEIVFPAASLQPPFFDINADDAANYGAIGANIGHEISHAFDVGGSQFDGNGVLRNWWTDADRKAFDTLGTRLAQQFDNYEPLPGKRVNGKLTLSENIADLSGVQVAYKAYLRSLNGKPSPRIDGRSGEQRFFLAAAQFRRAKMRDEAMTTMLSSDPHAPHEYRANGPAVNTDGFHQAFGTRPGDAMYRPASERIRIW
jgi:putative endopeptidase